MILAVLAPTIEARLKAIKTFSRASAHDAGLTADNTGVCTGPHRDAHHKLNQGTGDAQITNEALRLTYQREGFELGLLVAGASKQMQMRIG